MPAPFPQLDRPIDRVALIGCSGSGKSTLAPRLAELLELPLVHLDREYWRPGWVEPDHATWDAQHAALIAEPRWLLDGNYGRTMRQRVERADLVVQLLVPGRVALWRVVTRTLRPRSRVRSDMGEGCPERLFRRGTWAFWHYVATYERRRVPRVNALLAEIAADRTITLASRADVDALLAHLAAVR